ncbi:MAG: hypothetical protein IJ099_02390 [Alphaproteobacteria bacterium]|nr:hypothetical protein [Alphaproteobacteria bacterium]
MKKYAKIIDEATKQVQVGVGCSDEYYIEIGMTLMEVEQAYNGLWYIKGYAPIEPEPTEDEIKAQTIAELKANLTATDYAIIKIAEGAATMEEYAELIAQRQVWRKEINELGG